MEKPAIPILDARIGIGELPEQAVEVALVQRNQPLGPDQNQVGECRVVPSGVALLELAVGIVEVVFVEAGLV